MKSNPIKGRHSHRWLILPLLLAIPLLAPALQSDKDQPISIEADSVDIDDGKGISVYKGNVQLSQGSIRINAGEIRVIQHGGAAAKIEATGKPVVFRQQMDDDKGLVRGEADKAEYDADGEVLYMTGNAQLQQGKDTFKSDRIVYDRAKSVVRAGASAKGRERVKVTIGGAGEKK